MNNKIIKLLRRGKERDFNFLQQYRYRISTNHSESSPILFVEIRHHSWESNVFPINSFNSSQLLSRGSQTQRPYFETGGFIKIACESVEMPTGIDTVFISILFGVRFNPSARASWSERSVLTDSFQNRYMFPICFGFVISDRFESFFIMP